MNYRYRLETYAGKNSRYTCPSCGKAHRFTRYIDTHTGEHLSPEVGRCNREVKCGYHYTPKQYFQDNDHRHIPIVSTTKPIARHSPPHPPQHHTTAELLATLHQYERNNLVQYLCNRLGVAATMQLLQRYRVGTHQHWQGSTVFWYVNRRHQVCSGKVMQYHQHTGRRIKQPYTRITWMHRLLDKQHFVKRPCLFGEHLLTNTTLPVCLVESEKTALIAAHHMPDSIWLATGGISSINAMYCREVLAHRRLTLLPDAGGYTKWQAIAQQLPHCTISPLVEYYHHTPNDDIADLLAG